MTSRDYLSQEEIDALLKSTAVSDTPEETAPAGLSIDDYLTVIEQDALGEIGNITFGSAATALSTLLGRKVDITTPKVSAISKFEVSDTFPTPHVAVHVRYVEGFQGINMLVFKKRDAQVIADLMLGGSGQPEEVEELNEIHLSAVQEAMNQMMGSSATSMSTIFNRLVNISPPGINLLDFSQGEGDQLFTEDVFIKISFRLKIGDLVDSTIMQLLPVWFGKEMVSTLMGGGEPEPKPEANPAASAQQPVERAQAIPPTPASQLMPQEQTPPQPAYSGGASLPQQPNNVPPAAPPYAPPPPPQQASAANRNVQPAQFADFGDFNGMVAEHSNLNLLLDIPLKVTVELGRTKKQIKDILELSQGSVIELDKLAGEPVDILVNNKLIAKGEVVVIDENFGVRVTDIASPWDRLQKLQ